MSCSDGGNSGRSSSRKNIKSPKKFKATKSPSSDKIIIETIDEGSHSFHKKNFYIVSFPIIVLFNVFRTILYQVYLVFKHIYTSTSNFISRKQYFSKVGPGSVNIDQEAVESGEKSDSDDMAYSVRKPPGPGPGDPLLAKQKHHHRRAFEYISKALKIDEENEGNK